MRTLVTKFLEFQLFFALNDDVNNQGTVHLEIINFLVKFFAGTFFFHLGFQKLLYII